MRVFHRKKGGMVSQVIRRLLKAPQGKSLRGWIRRERHEDHRATNSQEPRQTDWRRQGYGCNDDVPKTPRNELPQVVWNERREQSVLYLSKTSDFAKGGR